MLFERLECPVRRLLAIALIALAGCTADVPEPVRSRSSEFLYLWTTTLPVPGLGNGPHHTEHEMPADRQLFANGFASGQSWVFDLNEPAKPRIVRQFGDLAGFSHPHSFLRLPNGNVLATFQMRHDHDSGAVRTGGLVELTPDGRPVRSRSADAAGADPDLRVYSGAIVPNLDRVVTTTTDMHDDHAASRNLQVWRLSDLTLLHTFPLPDGPAGNEGLLSAEPRLLPDGKTILVSTFSCGLYLMDGLAGNSSSARLVASFPQKAGEYCAIPVIAGRYYLVTVPAWSAVVSLDISNPAAPREVSRVTLGTDDVPHWISISPDQRRVVVTGYAGMQHRVIIARFDPGNGQLTLDDRFREEGADAPGFRMDNKSWPHGGDAKDIPHGAVFGRP